MRRERQKFESVTREFRLIRDKEGVLTFKLRGNTCWHKLNGVCSTTHTRQQI